MNICIKSFFLSILVLLLFVYSSNSYSETRRFNKPTVEHDKLEFGLPLDWCLKWGTDCGKPSADYFCQKKGFRKSVKYKKAEDIGDTKIMKTGQLCKGKTCDGFAYIECEVKSVGADKPAVADVSYFKEFYLIDVSRNAKEILQLVSVSWSTNPVLRPVYTASNYISAIAFSKYSRAYFVDLSHKNIYRTDGRTEKKIFQTDGSIIDLDFDSKGRRYFSVPPDPDKGGAINRMNSAGQIKKFAGISFPAGGVVGFWNGYFALNPSDKLFLSIDDPHPRGSTIYEYSAGKLQKRYTHNKVIYGFTFVDANTIYFTSNDNKVYKLKNFKNISIKHEDKGDKKFRDVQIVKVPKRGECRISGRLQGGKELWPSVSIIAHGPNVIWRTVKGSTIRVANDGTYELRNLPKGTYHVKADIRGDTMVGFNPKFRKVKCKGKLKNIDFSFSH